MYAKQIAIDGPAGAGKSTVAKAVARDLNYLYIDTGAMYRAIAWAALQEGIAVDDAKALGELAAKCQIKLQNDQDKYRVFLNDEDISEGIRRPEVGNAASPVSAVSAVRKALVKMQQQMAASEHVVMDGRDIATVVLPNAEAKIFLTADLNERAKRRTMELQAKGQTVSIEEVAADIAERDKRDSSRADSPLCQAKDAYLLDSTNLTIEEVIMKIKDIAQKEENK